MSLYAYDTETKQVRQAVKNEGLDFKSASGGPDAIVYDQLGTLFLFDPASGRSTRIPVTVAGDFPGVRPHFAKVNPVAKAQRPPYPNYHKQPWPGGK